MPNKKEIKKGTAATEYSVSVKYDMGMQSPDSVRGGSAATNFSTSPDFGSKAKNAFDSVQGGSAATNKEV